MLYTQKQDVDWQKLIRTLDYSNFFKRKMDLCPAILRIHVLGSSNVKTEALQSICPVVNTKLPCKAAMFRCPF